MKERKNEILLLGAVLAGVVTLNWLLHRQLKRQKDYSALIIRHCLILHSLW